MIDRRITGAKRPLRVIGPLALALGVLLLAAPGAWAEAPEEEDQPAWDNPEDAEESEGEGGDSDKDKDKAAETTKAPEVGDWTVDTCPPEDGSHSDKTIICVDAAQDGPPQITAHNAPHNLVKPNKGFLVMVRVRQGHKLNIQLAGVIGTTVPMVNTKAIRPEEGDHLGGDSGKAPRIPTEVIYKTFAPRQAGQEAPILVQVQGPDDPEPRQNMLELYVEATYVGAFRMGIAGVFLGGQDAHYSASTIPNSQQSEIVAQPGSLLDVDIVLGYAVFFDSGGRSPNGCESRPWCFAPYVGVGLLSPNEQGVDWFKSFHLGAEWEPVPNFSIALTGALRRVERLQRGAIVGGPVMAGQGVPTRQAWHVGVGIVINLSPDFAKISGAIP